MAPCSRPVGPDDKSGSDASSDVRKIFSDNGSGDLELDSDYSADDEDPDDSVDDETLPLSVGLIRFRACIYQYDEAF
jgi:hypothetical protein